MQRRGRRNIDLEGSGIYDDVMNYGKKTVNTVTNNVKSMANPTLGLKNTLNSVQDFGNTLINGRTDFGPEAKAVLAKYGNEPISGITIFRHKLASALTGAINAISGGSWNKQMANQSYDSLYHLGLIFQLNSCKIMFEKTEKLNFVINPVVASADETMVVSGIPQGLNLNNVMQRTAEAMGGKMWSYSSRDNNCQDEALACLTSGCLINNQTYNSFIKQDTKALFDNNNTGLRKLTNTVTDLAGRADIVRQGGSIKNKWVQHVKKISSDNNISYRDALKHPHTKATYRK